MKRGMVTVLIVGFVLGGLEGAVDAASLVHPDDETTVHDVHYRHAGDEDHEHRGEEPVPGEDPAQHRHVCHCGVHIPPLTFGLELTVSPSAQVRTPFERALNPHSASPPPLPPPIR